MELWTQEPDGSVVVRPKRHMSYLLGGAILALTGGAIGAQLVGAVAANRSATDAGWSEYIPVLLVFGGVAMAFIIPGALMMFYRRSIHFNFNTREVAEHRLYLGYRRSRSYALSAFNTIVFARRFRRRARRVGGGVSRGSGGSYPVFVVELASRGGKPLRVVMDVLEAPARQVATKLVASTGLTLRDEVEREREQDKTAAARGDDEYDDGENGGGEEDDEEALEDKK